jgi:malonyl-CoA decarboxylase
MDSAFFSDLMASIAERGRSVLKLTAWPRDTANRAASLADMCGALLTGRGEASGLALASEILARYRTLPEIDRPAFFRALADGFGPDPKRVQDAVARWGATGDEAAASEIHYASEPRRQELFRRLNRAPGGTAALVAMRADLFECMREDRGLAVVDRDFQHLFGSWFNRGFLVLRRIDWSSPAAILEKLIRYEAVHEIRDWDDLRRRIDPADRRCYAFFHPALVDEPLIFVEVALTREIPGAIAPILADKRSVVDPERATTAVFYSITNCQRGLAGVSFGSFLIKQVVEEVSREVQRVSKFVTLSPSPNFGAWLKRERTLPASMAIDEDDRAALAALDKPDWWRTPEIAEKVREPLLRAAAWYYVRGRNRRGRPIDAVARFHLGNGARLEQLDWLGDTSERALQNSYGLMVNYLYDLEYIERNHEAYAQQHTVVAAKSVSKLVRSPVREIVPVSG